MACHQGIHDAGHKFPRIRRPTQPRALLAGPCYLKATRRRSLGVPCSVEGPGPEGAVVEEAAAAAVLKKPRLQPFNPHSLARQRMLEFQRVMSCEGGNVLLVQPLEAACVKEAAGILTESFAESMGYLSVYKTFLHRQIIQYLELHTGLPPKTVVLVALLFTTEDWQALQQERGHAAHGEEARGRNAQDGSQAPSVSGNGSSRDACDGGPLQDLANGTGQRNSGSGVHLDPPPAGSVSTDPVGRDGASSRTGHDHREAAADLAVDAEQQGWQQQEVARQARQPEARWQEQQQQQRQVQDQPGTQARLPGLHEVAAAAVSQAFQRPARSTVRDSPDNFPQGTGSTRFSDVGLSAEGGALPGEQAAATAAREPGAAAANGSPPGVVVGVVEVSFAASTRTKYLTLNPPEDRPYLCNMAVAPERRGQGFGTLLMRAAEDLVTHMGERDLYLHVRAQDESAARLYLKAGFKVLKEDNFFVVLLRQDRRLLMRKQLR